MGHDTAGDKDNDGRDPKADSVPGEILPDRNNNVKVQICTALVKRINKRIINSFLEREHLGAFQE
jgi:hypothetical protein